MAQQKPKLYQAAQQDSPECLEKQIQRGANNATTSLRGVFEGHPIVTGVSPLHLSARRAGSVRCLQWLLAHGANALARDYLGQTCMYYANHFGNPEGLEGLVKKLCWSPFCARAPTITVALFMRAAFSTDTRWSCA
eukprot:TRINITY_DN76720_c0_g1_i2.p1 TRINITY_DN76720_c0_g1~~TRINITY_DN76720_c0_g1_i2.p1  ORF type:complete len:136 (+),score=24.58 TRINITY_DN76720_c0_g1_i2:190-597(+)